MARPIAFPAAQPTHPGMSMPFNSSVPCAVTLGLASQSWFELHSFRATQCRWSVSWSRLLVPS